MERIEGEFTQVTRSKIPGDFEIPAGWFVISYKLVECKKDRRLLHGRWFSIKSPNGEIFRILRFSPHLEPKSLEDGSKTKGEIILDWPGWVELSGYGEAKEPLDLVLEEAGWWRFPQLVMSHPDPMFRLAGLLGLISVGLGILSLFLAL